MRLTLRNLLAYMDGLLDSESSNDLKQKIDTNKDVTDLIHRIKDTTRRMRLAAPKVEGKSSSLDPNSVAEYLDNTLPDEKVADVEKVCIESDIHLAEVASCHHILTLVLGEPATVNEDTRRKMYSVPNNIEALRSAKELPPPPPTTTTTSTTSTITPATENKTTRGVPDYLREGQKSRVLPWVITAVLAAGITAAVLYLPGVFNKKDRDVELTQNNKKENNKQPKDDQPKQPLPKEKIENDNPPISIKDGKGAAPNVPMDKDLNNTNNQSPKTTTNPPIVPPKNGTADDKDDTTDKKNPIDKPDTKTNGTDKKSTEPIKDSNQNPTTVGRYLSENSQVLLGYEKDTQQWTRLANGSKLQTGTRLVSLPVFQPKIAIAGITLQMVNGTIIDLKKQDKATPSLRLVNGQIADMLSVGPDENTKIHVDFGNRQGTLTIKNADTHVAMEVRRFRSLGDDPRTSPGPVLSTIYVLDGTILWQSANESEPTQISKGGALSFVGKNPGKITAAKTPDWADKDEGSTSNFRSLNERAATVLKEIKTTRPASISLAEKTNHRRVEVRYLASAGQALIGNFSGLVSGLKDPDLKWFWRERYINSLVDGLLRSPEDAKQIYSAFESSFGKKDAEILFRMLWGYHPNQLKQGIADKLITDYLVHSNVAYRALSIYNLALIKGADYRYEPSNTPNPKSTAVKRWQNELKNGPLVYKTTPPVLPTKNEKK